MLETVEEARVVEKAAAVKGEDQRVAARAATRVVGRVVGSVAATAAADKAADVAEAEQVVVVKEPAREEDWVVAWEAGERATVAWASWLAEPIAQRRARS